MNRVKWLAFGSSLHCLTGWRKGKLVPTAPGLPFLIPSTPNGRINTTNSRG
jgi:hypothetical protein